MHRATSRRAILAGVLLAGALGACASPGIPPGGPEDEEPPVITRIRPDTNAVNVKSGRVGFDFDEVISERPQGAPNLAELFLISPSKGLNGVSWRRTRVEVWPRGGLRPNTTYRVTMLPGLADLDGNVDSVGRTIVFSTGATIASGRISGRVFDWLEERPARQAYVEAMVLPDSLRYLAMADSLGAYELRNLPPGQYLLRGIMDQNKNRLLDLREPYDTVTVTLADTARHTLHALARDTLGPSIERIELADSLTIRVRFDKALDTLQVIDTSRFVITDRDSNRVAIRRALGARVVKRLADDSVRQKQIQDSVRAANDTTRRRADSARTAARPPARPPARPAAGARPRADTTPPPPKPTVKIPEVEVVITLAAPLPPNGNFRLRAVGMRSIVGRTRPAERAFQSVRRSREELRRDSLRRDSLRRDSVRRDTVRRDSAGRDTMDVGGPPHRENGELPAILRHLLVPTPAQSTARPSR